MGLGEQITEFQIGGILFQLRVEVFHQTGEVANVVNKPASLPTIRVSLYDAHDNELQFVTLANARQTLAAGETLVFDTRITDPRPEAKRVRVGFTPSRQVTRP